MKELAVWFRLPPEKGESRLIFYYLSLGSTLTISKIFLMLEETPDLSVANDILPISASEPDPLLPLGFLVNSD